MASGYGGAAVEAKPVEATINDRLGKVLEGFQFQCDRISGVLSRVNATPPQQPGPNRDSVAQIRQTMPLTVVVEQLQELQERLADLATGVERIA